MYQCPNSGASTCRLSALAPGERLSCAVRSVRPAVRHLAVCPASSLDGAVTEKAWIHPLLPLQLSSPKTEYYLGYQDCRPVYEDLLPSARADDSPPFLCTNGVGARRYRLPAPFFPARASVLESLKSMNGACRQCTRRRLSSLMFLRTARKFSSSSIYCHLFRQVTSA